MNERTASELRDLREAASYMKVYTRPTIHEKIKPIEHSRGCFSCNHKPGPRLADEKRYSTVYVQAIKDVAVDADGDPQFQVLTAFSLVLCTDDKAWVNQTDNIFWMHSGHNLDWPRLWYNYFTWEQINQGSIYVRQYRIGEESVRYHVNSRVDIRDMLPDAVKENPKGWNYHVNVQPEWGPGVYLDIAGAVPFGGRAINESLRIASTDRAIEFTQAFTKKNKQSVLLNPVEPLRALKPERSPKAYTASTFTVSWDEV